MKLSSIQVICTPDRAKTNTHKLNWLKEMSVSNLSVNSAMLSYGIKLPTQGPYMALGMGSSPVSLDIQRAQLQEYTQRLQLGMRAYPSHMGINGLSYHSQLTNPYLNPYFYKDPRARFIHEEPKPNHSYIGLIAMAILSAKDKKLVLSDIYQWILDNYTYFRTRGPGWRNSIRHNLSLNDCFIKAGRSANGKGHYWAIHPANLEDFQKGDFRRRRAQRRVRKHMGLAVPDDEDSPSPSESPVNHWADADETNDDDFPVVDRSAMLSTAIQPQTPSSDEPEIVEQSLGTDLNSQNNEQPKRAKRTFDMDSLLAPDSKKQKSCSADRDVNLKSNVDIKTESDSEVVIDLNDNTNASGITESKSLDTNKSDDMKDSDEAENLYVNVDDSLLEASKELKTASTLPLLDRHLLTSENMSGLPRSSAFRNPAQYSWGGLSSYLSSYQIMALNAAGPHSVMVPGSSLSNPSAQRWQQTMAHFLMQARLKEASEDQN